MLPDAAKKYIADLHRQSKGIENPAMTRGWGLRVMSHPCAWPAVAEVRMANDSTRQVRGVPVPNRFWISGLLAVLLIAVGAPARPLEPSLHPSQYVLDNW